MAALNISMGVQGTSTRTKYVAVNISDSVLKAIDDNSGGKSWLI